MCVIFELFLVEEAWLLCGRSLASLILEVSLQAATSTFNASF